MIKSCHPGWSSYFVSPNCSKTLHTTVNHLTISRDTQRPRYGSRTVKGLITHHMQIHSKPNWFTLRNSGPNAACKSCRPSIINTSSVSQIVYLEIMIKKQINLYWPDKCCKWSHNICFFFLNNGIKFPQWMNSYNTGEIPRNEVACSLRLTGYSSHSH